MNEGELKIWFFFYMLKEGRNLPYKKVIIQIDDEWGVPNMEEDNL